MAVAVDSSTHDPDFSYDGDDEPTSCVPVVTTPTEEELVRKGVFSCAVRRLLTASLEEKRGLCKLVDEMTNSRSGGTTAAGKKRPRSSADDSSTVARSVNVVADPQSLPAQGALPADEAMLLTNQADVFLDEISHVSDFVVSAALSAIDSIATAPTPGVTPETVTASAEERRSDESAVSSVAYDLLTMEEATERLAAYLRQLLDRTVGFVLDALDRNALRFLCVLLEISPNPPKAKDVLYSLLSHFYFQRSNMGKRVVSNRTAVLNAQQDAAALASIPSNRTGAGRARGSSAKAVEVLVAKSAAREGAAESQSKKASLVAPRSSSTPTPLAARDTSKATEKKSTAEERSNAGEFLAAPSVFRSRRAQMDHSGDTFMKPNADECPSTLMGPSAEATRRKLLGIVQVLEPITLGSLTAKLRQIPAFASCTAPQVHRLVETLVEQGRVMLDSGIVYLAA